MREYAAAAAEPFHVLHMGPMSDDMQCQTRVPISFWTEMGIKSLALLLQILGKADAVWRHVTEYVILANHLLMISYSSIDIDKPLLPWHGPIYSALRQVTTIISRAKNTRVS